MTYLERVYEDAVAYKDARKPATLADVAGVSEPTMRRYMRDPGAMPRKVAKRLAWYLHCDVEDIYKEEV